MLAVCVFLLLLLHVMGDTMFTELRQPLLGLSRPWSLVGLLIRSGEYVLSFTRGLLCRNEWLNFFHSMGVIVSNLVNNIP